MLRQREVLNRKLFSVLPGDAHEIRRFVTRLSSDRVKENRSVNAESITDDEIWSKTLHK
jgi:hypothetical protein